MGVCGGRGASRRRGRRRRAKLPLPVRTIPPPLNIHCGSHLHLTEANASVSLHFPPRAPLLLFSVLSFLAARPQAEIKPTMSGWFGSSPAKKPVAEEKGDDGADESPIIERLHVALKALPVREDGEVWGTERRGEGTGGVCVCGCDVVCVCDVVGPSFHLLTSLPPSHTSPTPPTFSRTLPTPYPSFSPPLLHPLSPPPLFSPPTRYPRRLSSPSVT